MPAALPHRSVAELETAEQRLQDAVVASNVDELDELLDDSVTFTGPDGSSIGKREDLDAHRSGTLDIQTFRATSVAARVIDGVGLTFVEASLAGTTRGRPFSTRMRYTRAWAHGPAGWRVVAAHASELSSAV